MVKLLGLITVVSSAMISHSPAASTIQIVGAGPDLNGDGTSGDDVIGDINLGDFGLNNSIITSGGVFTILGGGADLSLAAADSITVDAATNWGSANTLTLAANTVTINQAVTAATGTVAISVAETAAGAFNLNADLNASSATVSSTNSNNASFAVNFVPTGSVSFSGSGTADSLSVAGLVGAPVTVAATGANAGSLAGGNVTFIGVDSIVGRSGDTFDAGANTFNAGVGLDGGMNVSVFNNVIASSLNLTTGADAFTVTGVGAGNISGVNYTGLTSVDALGGSDTVSLTAGNDTLTLTGANTGSVAGIAFTNIESVDAGGGSDTLNTNSGAALTGVAGQVFTHGVTVSNLENLASTNGLLNGTAGDDTLNLTGTNAGNGYGVNFTGISTLSAGIGNDTLNTNAPTTITATAGLVTTNGVNVGGLENLVSTDGNLQTTGLVDNITLTGNEAGNVRGINFTGITDLDAFGGSDTLNTNAATTLTGTAGQVTSNGVTVSNLEVLGTSNGTLNGTASADTINLTGTTTGNAGGISFSDVNTIDAAGGSDTVNTNAPTTLTGSSSQITTNGVTVSNVENLVSTDGNLVATASDDSINLTGTNSGTANFVQFSGISEVDAGGGTDTLNTTAAVTLTGVTKEVTTNGVTVSNVETVFATNTLLNGSAGADVIQLGATGVVANGVTIVGITTINGGDGSDQLDVTNAASMNGVTFNGGGPTGSDSILISDTSSVTTVTHTFINANDGSIDADGNTLNYTGLEPVIDNLSATDRNFNFTGGAETITLQNAAGAGMMNIDSTLGETVTFTNPSTTLNINVGLGDDVLDIQGLDPAYAGALNITDSAGNLDLAGVNVTNPAVVTSIDAAGNLTDSGNISIAGATTLNGVDITLGGAGEVTNFGALTITASGNVTIQEDSITNLVGANTADSLNLTSTLGTLINGSVVTLTGEQVYNSAVTLSGATSLSAVDTDADGEGIDFGSTVAGGGNNLTISGGAGFAGAVSGIDLLNANHIDSESTISAANIIVSGTSDLGGNVTTTGIQSYAGNVLLTADVELDGSSINSGAIDAGGNTLTLDGASFVSTGAITNGNLVTQTAATIASGDLGTLTVGGGELNVTGNLTTTGAITGDQVLDIDGNLIAGSTTMASVLEVAGTSSLGGNVTTAGSQTFAGSVILTTNVELDGTSIMAGAIDTSGNTLTLDGSTSVATGAITNGALITETDATIASFNGTTVNVTAGNLTVSGMLTASGAVTNNDTLTLTGVNTAGSYISNGGTLNNTGATLNAGSYDLNTGSIVNANLGNGVIEADGTVAINGNTGTGPLNVNNGTTTIGALANISGVVIVDAGANLANGGTIVPGLINNGTTVNTGTVTGSTTNTATGTITNTGTGVLTGNVINSGGGITTDTNGIADTASLANSGTVNFTGTDTIANYSSNGGTLQTAGTAPNAAILTVTGSYTEMGTLSTGLTRVAMAPGATLIVDASTGGGVTAGQVDLDGSTLDLTSTAVSVAAEFGERYNIIRVNGPGEITNGGGSGSIGFDTFTTAGVGPGAVNVGDVLFDISTGDVVTLGAPLVIQDDAGKAITLVSSSRGNSVNQRAIFNAVIAGATDRDISGGGSANFDGADGGLGTLLSGVLADPSNLDSLNSLSPEAYAGAVDYALQATRHYSEAARLGHGHGLTSGNYQVTAGYTSFGIGSGTSEDDGDYDMDGSAGFVALRYRADGSNTSYGGFVGIDEGTIEGSFLDLDTEGFVLGAFVDHQFEYDGRSWNLWGNISYGSFEYSGDRSTTFGGASQLNSVDSIDANTLELGVGANVEAYSENGFSVRPGVGFRVLHTTVDDFAETGSISALSVSGMDYSSYLLDARIDVAYRPEGQKFGLNGHLGWQHDFANGSRDVSASFASSNEFTVIAPGLDRDALTYGVGGFYDVSDNMRIDLQYRGENRKNDNSFGVDLRFTIGF